MDILLLQLILWFGMLFLIWVLKDSLGSVESTIEEGSGSQSPAPPPAVPERRYSLPEQVFEPIGFYRDAPIYRYARINGKDYQFEHVWVAGDLRKGQRCLAPGLIYSERRS